MTRMLRGLTASALFALAMPAVAAESPQTPFHCEPGETYYMNVMMSGIEYWKPVFEMFKQAAEQMGCEAKFTGTPEYDVNRQLATFEQVLARDPAGIFLHPMNPDPFIGPIERARKMGVPVVTFAADSPRSDRVSYITSNNTREGRIAADTVAEALEGTGKYAVLENPGQDNHDRRTAAFIERMEAEYPDMELVSRAASNQDPSKAYNAVLTIGQSHPDLDAVFMPEATSAIGAAQAAKELGKDIVIMSVDINAKVLDMIKAGEMHAAINPDQGMQGYMGFMLTWLAAHPGLIDPMNDYESKGFNPMRVPYVDNGLSVVTADNADAFYWDKYEAEREQAEQ